MGHQGAIDAQAVQVGPGVHRQVVEGHRTGQPVGIHYQFRHRPKLAAIGGGGQAGQAGSSLILARSLPTSPQAYHEPGSKWTCGLLCHSSPRPVASSVAPSSASSS